MAQAEAVPMRAVATVPRASTGATLGRVVFSATWALCAVAGALDLHAGSYRALGYVVVAAAVAVAGVVLTSRLPRHRVSWVLAAGALWWALAGLSNAYAIESLVVGRDSLPGGFPAAWFDNWAWLPGLVVFTGALLVLVPDGHLPSRRWWPAPAAVVAGCVVASSSVAFWSTFELGDVEVANPWSSGSPAVWIAGVLGLVLILAGLAASLAAFVVRFRQSEGETRQQLRWVGASLALSVLLGVVGAGLWGVFPGAATLPALAVLILPAGIAVAALRYRLYELDLVVNRALVYLVLTVFVTVAYVVAVGLVGSYLSRRADLVVSLVVTGAVAVGFQPLRERAQRVVNRLMYGDRDDPYRAISGLGRTLARSLQADAVLPAAVDTIGRTLALQYVGIRAVRAEDDARDLAAYGAPAADVLLFPLIHQGAPIGELRLSSRAGEKLRERDRRLVADLAPQVAAAMHSVELSNELQSARMRIVRLREEERRRIRRDLHDGLGPALAGLTFTMDAARNLVPSDPGRADELLASAAEQAQTLIVDVRRLIYGLRPPALDQLGLVGALEGLVAKEGSSRTRLIVEAPDPLPPLEAAVEVSSYRIVQEALMNVARHAHARTSSVRIALESDALHLEVRDDGRGFSQHRLGVGLGAMRERAVELGGTCEIASTPGTGTVVSVRLPRETPLEVET